MDWKSHFRRVSQRERALKRGIAVFGAEFGNEPPDIIKQAQAKLNALGYANPPLVIDGDAGPATQAATRAFQLAKGLSDDGIIGPQTLSALGITVSAKSLTQIPGAPISGLKQSVVDAFTSYTTGFEGYTPFMYSDSKGYVTTGIGNLIDPIGAALSLPWKNPDGSLASQSQIQDAWNTVKNAYPGTQSSASASLTNIRLDKDAIGQIVHSKLATNNQVLMQRYPNFSNLPADAQLALHSISWAWGPAFSSVWNNLGLGDIGSQFDNAIANNDFTTAQSLAAQAGKHEETKNAGIVPRDAAQNTLFSNAADVISKGASTATLFYPGGVAGTAIKAGLGILGMLVVGALGAIGLMFAVTHKGK